MDGGMKVNRRNEEEQGREEKERTITSPNRNIIQICKQTCLQFFYSIYQVNGTSRIMQKNNNNNKNRN